MSQLDPLAPFRLDGRVAILTGASAELGARFARVLDAGGVDAAMARHGHIDVLVNNAGVNLVKARPRRPSTSSATSSRSTSWRRSPCRRSRRAR